MYKNIFLRNFVLVVFILVTMSVGFMVGLFFGRNKQLELSYKNIDADTPIAIGNTCNYKGWEMDTNGFQCYWYGDIADSRKGIWIKPDVRFTGDPSLTDYKDYFLPWRKYVSTDNKVRFSFPSFWYVDDIGYKDSDIIKIGQGRESEQPSVISLQVVKKNAETVRERIEEIKKENSTVIEFETIINDMQAIKLEVAPKTNLLPDRTYIFFDKGSYYIFVEADKTGAPSVDAATGYLLGSIK